MDMHRSTLVYILTYMKSYIAYVFWGRSVLDPCWNIQGARHAIVPGVGQHIRKCLPTMLDKNSDGVLTKDEIMAFGIGKKEVSKMFRDMDKNGE